jgi:hypothetical protein
MIKESQTQKFARAVAISAEQGQFFLSSSISHFE